MSGPWYRQGDPAWFLVAVVGVLALPKLVLFWLQEPIFSLGFIVAPWAVWWIARLSPTEVGALPGRLGLLLGTLLLAGLGWRLGSLWISLLALVLALASVALEKGRLRSALLPLGLLTLMGPPPFFTSLLNGAQLFVAASSSVMLAAFGVPVRWEAFTLETANYSFVVTPLCSGMSGLLATTALVGIAGAHLWPGRRRVLVALGLGVALTVLLNLLRVVILIAITEHWGPRFIESAFHDGVSLVMSIAVTLAVLPILLGPGASSRAALGGTA